MPQSRVQPHPTLFSIRAARSFQSLFLVPVEGTRNELFRALWSFRSDSQYLETAGFPTGETIIFILVLANTGRETMEKICEIIESNNP